MYVSMCGYVHESNAYIGQKRGPDSPELELQAVVNGPAYRVLGTKLITSERAGRSLEC